MVMLEEAFSIDDARMSCTEAFISISKPGNFPKKGNWQCCITSPNITKCLQEISLGKTIVLAPKRRSK